MTHRCMVSPSTALRSPAITDCYPADNVEALGGGILLLLDVLDGKASAHAHLEASTRLQNWPAGQQMLLYGASLHAAFTWRAMEPQVVPPHCVPAGTCLPPGHAARLSNAAVSGVLAVHGQQGHGMKPAALEPADGTVSCGCLLRGACQAGLQVAFRTTRLPFATTACQGPAPAVDGGTALLQST